MTIHDRHILMLVITVTALLTAVGAASAGDLSDDASPLRLLRVFTPKAQDLSRLQSLGIDIISREAPDRVRIAAGDQAIATLDRLGYRYEIVQLDLEAYYRRRLGADARAYHTFEQVEQELDRMRLTRPDLVASKLALGTTWEGRSIWAVKISDNPEFDEDEPEVIYDALHHAREPVSMETLLAAMWHLIRNYDSDPAIRHLVDERELWFVPVVNPDGYAWNVVGGLWRKNRRPNLDGSRGVDLNRNYAHEWGHDDLGSSPVPASQTYRGPRPFSEPETRAMRDFILDHSFVTGMTLHAFANVHLLPCGWAEVRPAHWEDLRELGSDLQERTGYPFGQPWELLYLSNGRTQDWVYNVGGVIMMEPEIGRASDGFWPPAKRVAELAAENLPSILHVARVAGAHLEVTGHRLLDAAGHPGAGHPGESVELALTVRNKGYADSGDYTATLAPATSMVTVDTAARRLPAVAARTTLADTGLRFAITIGADAQPGLPLELELVWIGADGYYGEQTITITPGAPELLFADDAEHGAGNWHSTGGWGVVSVPESAGKAYADSPRGPYLPRSDNALVMREPISLADCTAAHLEYRERFFVEPWADPCRIEATANNRDWVTLATLAGGAQAEFRPRRISLDAFAGQESVRLRFRLTANDINQKDGWTIDDIRIWGYTQPASFSAALPPPPGTPSSPETDAATVESE